MLSTPRAQQGFSLVEVVVVIAVLGTLLLAVLPNMTSWMRSVTVRGAAESVQAGLQKARMEALRRNRVVTLWLVTPGTSTTLDANCALSSAAASWVVSIDDPAGKCDVEPSPSNDPRIVEVATTRQTGVTVEARARNGAAATSVGFNGFGQVVQSGGEIATVDFSPSQSGTGARNLRVAISPAGGIRMCDRDVDASDPRAC